MSESFEKLLQEEGLGDLDVLPGTVVKGKILDIIYHGQENELIIISNISKEPIIVKCHKDQKLDLNSEISLYCENKSFRLY